MIDDPTLCKWRYDEDESDWVTAGYFEDGTSAEFFIPTSNQCAVPRGSKWLALRLVLTGLGTGTPIIDAIKLKYFVPILDYFRFSFAVGLPKDCLNDGCGIELPEYDQSLWDEAIRDAVCSIEPVKFRDIDGTWYEVRVESASRRIEKVDYGSGVRKWDISWSLVLVQLNSTTICGPEWVPPVCP